MSGTPCTAQCTALNCVNPSGNSNSQSAPLCISRIILHHCILHMSALHVKTLQPSVYRIGIAMALHWITLGRNGIGFQLETSHSTAYAQHRLTDPAQCSCSKENYDDNDDGVEIYDYDDEDGDDDDDDDDDDDGDDYDDDDDGDDDNGLNAVNFSPLHWTLLP